MRTFSERAHQYIIRGFKVFPLVPGAKRPITARGVHDATSDPGKIIEWSKTLPEGCNVGVACGGESGRQGLAVIDIDGHKDGYYSIQKLVRANEARMPFTASVRTPKGGLHLYFAYSYLSNRVNALPGVDVRSDGGYVVGAGSVFVENHIGKEYEWQNPLSDRLAYMPKWLYDAMLAPPPVPIEARPKLTPTERSTEYKRLLALARHVRQAPNGQRNSTLYWAVNRALDNGFDCTDTMIAEMTNAGQACGLSYLECRKTIDSALRAREESAA